MGGSSGPPQQQGVPPGDFPTQPGPSAGYPPQPGPSPSFPPQPGPSGGIGGFPSVPGGGGGGGGAPMDVNWGSGPPMGTPAIPPPGGYVEPPQPENHYSQFSQPEPTPTPDFPTNSQPGPAAQPGTLGGEGNGGPGVPAPDYDELEERFNKLGQ